MVSCPLIQSARDLARGLVWWAFKMPALMFSGTESTVVKVSLNNKTRFSKSFVSRQVCIWVSVSLLRGDSSMDSESVMYSTTSSIYSFFPNHNFY